MPNNITLAQQFVPVLDEIYKLASLTSSLDGSPELAREGANAGELIIPMLEMQGLGDYSRNAGYAGGDVTLTNATVKCNYERGRMFTVDAMDDQETAGIAFGRLAGEFIRTKVVPELDAFRFAAYAGKEGISKAAPAALTTGAAVIAALRAATNQMDEDEVPTEERRLFITPTLHGMVQDLDTTKSREVLSRFAAVTLVPQSRFYTKIDLRSGANTDGDATQAAGGYAKSADSLAINFMVLHPSALIQFQKHVAPKIIAPEQNQNADAYKFGYRCYGIADVYKNKLAGVYLHSAPAATK